MNDLKELIREVPDFPEPGINFYDITTLLKSPRGLREVVDRFCWCFMDRRVDKVVGMESRGFLFGPIIAYDLNAGFIPARKPGKLPAKTVSHEYDLEYGTDCLQIHEDAIEENDNVLIVDDVIATGGTAQATAKLIESCGGRVVGLGFVIELDFLKGRDRLDGYDVTSLIHYD